MDEQSENSSSTDSPDIESSKPKKGRRGPAAGKWQNGRGCFSAWYGALFLISLRRLAANMQTDPASLVQNVMSGLTERVRLTDEDLAELKAAEATVQRPSA